MRCPHCGARNASEAAGRSCVSCGRTLPGASSSRSAFEELQQVGGLADFDPGSPLGGFGNDLDTADDGLDGGLGAMPTGDEAARLDMAQLLGTDSTADDGAPFFGGGGGDGFRFGSSPAPEAGLGSLDGGFAAFDDDDEATRGALHVQIPPEALRDSLTLNLSGPPVLADDAEEESTRVVDQRYVDEAMKAAPLELGIDAPTPEGWKVRNERGVVYELMTVDAVVAWLEGKPDISGVRVARGDGVFMEVDAFPELSGRLGVRKPVEDVLSLDISRASDRHGGTLGEQRSVAQRAESTQHRESGPASLGFGVVLAAVAVAFLCVIGITLVGVATGGMELPPDIEPAAQGEPAPSPALARAIGDYESGAYDAAINQLQALARSETPDPRVQRYLALALHHNNRDAEARRALAEYRRQLRAEPGR